MQLPLEKLIAYLYGSGKQGKTTIKAALWL